MFSHTGQMHGEVKRFIKDQIRLQLTYTEGEAKSSKVQLAFRWWSKCLSSVISRTASRNGYAFDVVVVVVLIAVFVVVVI